MKKFEAVNSSKKITLEMMMDYILENCPEKKAWFKKEAYSKADGTELDHYNHLNAVRVFCSEFAPDLLPKKKKTKAGDVLKDW